MCSLYAPLDASNREIRLLHLAQASQPSASESPSCRISCVSLQSVPSYTALSYVWGINKSPTPIYVNGHPLSVTQNLYTALLHLRDKDEEVVLWIDALCINQSNSNEKSTQIQLMRDIYAEATEVLIWLGPGTTQTDLAMKWIERLGGALVQAGFERLSAERIGSWDSEASIEELEFVTTGHGIQDLMQKYLAILHDNRDPFFWRNGSDLGERQWFERAWCLQECASGKKVFFQCGDARVQFDDFWAVAFFVSVFTTWASQHHGTGDVQRDANIRLALREIAVMLPTSSIGIRQIRLHKPDDKRLNLKRLLCRFNVFQTDNTRIQATLPIDRVYALLNIANDHAPTDISPDYGGGCARAYITTAKALLSYGHLDILGLCRKRTEGHENELPSWVPDWAAENRQPWTLYHEHGMFNASNSAAASVSFNPNTGDCMILRTHGVILGTVSHIGRAWMHRVVDVMDRWAEDPDESTAEYHNTLRNLLTDISDFVLQSSHDVPSRDAEATWRVPICDIEQSGALNIPRRATAEARNGHAYLRDLLNHDTNSRISRTEHYAAFQTYLGRLRRVHDSRPFLTRKGYVGMCPVETRTGDTIVIFRGAKVPYIIRDQGESWRLIGESYVHGAMDGEAWEPLQHTIRDFVLL